MITGKVALFDNYLLRLKAESVSVLDGVWIWGSRLYPLWIDDYLTFTHVLNVHNSEELWLADAVELFVPEYFAKRCVGGDTVYRQRGAVADHMRNELFRQACSPQQVTLESVWLSEHMLYCYERDGSYAEELYGEVLVDSSVDDYFGDSSGDEDDEPDTLSSELLLTEVYIAPDRVSEALDAITGLKCPVNMISPTEQED